MDSINVLIHAACCRSSTSNGIHANTITIIKLIKINTNNQNYTIKNLLCLK